MPTSSYAYQSYLLRSISDQMQLPEIKQVASKPGTQAIYRMTCHYPDGTSPDSVATLTSTITQQPLLTIHYLNRPESTVETFVDKLYFQKFVSALYTLKFDRMDDQPDIPAHGVVLWMVERGAGSFVKRVILAPDFAANGHQALIYRIHEFFPRTVERLMA
jgi:hypothetical protein